MTGVRGGSGVEEATRQVLRIEMLLDISRRSSIVWEWG